MRALAIRFRAKGHPNVRSTHRSTIEVTKERSLTERGDCIIGVESELSAAELPAEMRELMKSDSMIVAVFCAGGICDSVVGRGSSTLKLSDPMKMVFRRSDYIGPETVMIKANKAAKDLSRDLISALARGEGLEVTLIVLHE